MLTNALTKHALAFFAAISSVLIAGSLEPLSADEPTGWHDSLTRDSAVGWACDPDKNTAAVAIHVYKEGGVFIGSALANQYRGDLATASVCGDSSGTHGFTFTLPASLKDGASHTIYTYALDIDANGTITGGPNPLLSGSPISVFFPATPAETYFAQPFIAASQVDTTIIGEIAPPATNQFFVRMAGLGPQPDTTPVTWNVGLYTGLTVDSTYQRGPSDTPGASAVQVKDNVAGLWINTSAPPSPPYSSIVAPITPAYWWTLSADPPANCCPEPWSATGSELSFSFELQVPYAARQGAGQVYADGYILFRDKTPPNHSFWYGANVFDLRPVYPDLFFPSDQGGTFAPVVLASLAGSSYVHLGTGSNGFQQSTWTGYRYFDVRISRAEFQSAINRVRQDFPVDFSDNPANYQVTHFNFNPEVAPNGTGNGQIGSAVRYLQIARYAAPVVPVSDHVFIRGANASSNPNLQVFFKTSISDFYSEDKSVWMTFPTGGGWLEIVVDMGQNANWRGTITGIRVDPFNAAGSFGIDYVYIGDVNRNYVQRWEFDGANPLSGWSTHGIVSIWTDSSLGTWGGMADASADPFFYTDTNFSSGK